MKKEYKLKDGGVITASSPEEFIRNLRLSSMFGSKCTDAEYMVEFGYRYKIQTGSEIRTDTASNFMDDLKKTGFILESS